MIDEKDLELEDNDEDDIKENPWHIKYFKLISILMCVFGFLFVLTGIVSLLGLFQILNFNLMPIIYIVCLLSLIFTIISYVLRVIAENNNGRFDL